MADGSARGWLILIRWDEIDGQFRRGGDGPAGLHLWKKAPLADRRDRGITKYRIAGTDDLGIGDGAVGENAEANQHLALDRGFFKLQRILRWRPDEKLRRAIRALRGALGDHAIEHRFPETEWLLRIENLEPVGENVKFVAAASEFFVQRDIDMDGTSLVRHELADLLEEDRFVTALVGQIEHDKHIAESVAGDEIGVEFEAIVDVGGAIDEFHPGGLDLESADRDEDGQELLDFLERKTIAGRVDEFAAFLDIRRMTVDRADNGGFAVMLEDEDVLSRQRRKEDEKGNRGSD